MNNSALNTAKAWSIGLFRRVLFICAMLLLPAVILLAGPWWLLTGRDPFNDIGGIYQRIADLV